MASVLSAGTTSNTALNLSADTTGILQFQTNGTTAAMTLDTSQNVGIGVTPSAWRSTNKALQIGQSAAIFGYTASNIVGLSANSYIDSAGNEKYITNGTGGSYFIGPSSGEHRWSIFPNNTSGPDAALTPTEVMRITSAGNVGIGLTNPAQTLDVFGQVKFGTSAGRYFQFITDSSASYLDTSHALNLRVNGASSLTTALTIDTSGNVGIGTTSPSTYGKFAVVGSSGSVESYVVNTGTTVQSAVWTQNNVSTKTGVIQYGSGQGPYGAVSAGEGFFYSNNSLTVMSDNAGAIIKFATGGNTERMRITSAGQLLVGTTTSRGIGTFFASSGNAMGVEHSGSNTVTAIEFRQGGPSAVVGSISLSNGNATAYNTSSDHRLKENIAPMTGALAKVAQLKPCTYTWKATGKAGQGFIAHELQAVVPDAVTGEKDAVDEEGNIKPQGVDTSFLVATLTAAIQELKAELDATKAEVAALKGVK